MEASPVVELVELRFTGEPGGQRYRARVELEPGTRLIEARFAGTAWPAARALLSLRLRDDRPPIEREVTQGIHDLQRLLSVEDVGVIDARLVVKHASGGGGALTVGLLVARPRLIEASCELRTDAEAVVGG